MRCVAASLPKTTQEKDITEFVKNSGQILGILFLRKFEDIVMIFNIQYFMLK